MTIISDLKDFAQGLARGFGLFIFERNHFAGVATNPSLVNGRH